MAGREGCSVCDHPSYATADGIAKAIARGDSSRSIAIQFPPLSHGAVTRHRNSPKCKAIRPTSKELAHQRKANAALVQVEVSAKNSIRDLVTQRLDRSTIQENQLDALWDDAFGQLTDEHGKLRPMVDEEGCVRFDMLEQLLQLSKARVDARGGGSLKWATLAAQVDGLIKTGPQTVVLIQDGRVVHPELGKVLEAVAMALEPYPDAAEAVHTSLKRLRGSAS